MKNLPCAPARKADSFDLPCTTLSHFRIDAHNPAPRITFRKQNVCAAAFQRRAPSRLKRCRDGVASHFARSLCYRRFAPALPSGIPVQMVVPPVSLAAVLQGTALTVCVETSSGATLSKPGPVSISGKAVGCKPVPRRALAQMCLCHFGRVISPRKRSRRP
jgi:hypothetical protein